MNEPHQLDYRHGVRRRLLISLSVGLLCLVGTPCLAMQAQTPDSVLVRNVRLIDRDGQVEDRIVNILIKNGRLDIVTEDAIPVDEAELAVDGENGILLGTLDLQQPATFLILDGDPRENVQSLLDTKTYARFAIVDGEITTNTLPRASPASPDEEEKHSGWLAYNPPPLSLPSSYQDSSKWNTWDTKYISGALLVFLALDRHWWPAQDAANEEQVGDLVESDRGGIRGLRFGAVGNLNFARPWHYTVFIASLSFDRGFDTTRQAGLKFFDYRLDIPLGNQGTLSVGKQKEPFSMDRIMGLLFEPMMERGAVSDAMMPSRNVGVVYNNTMANERVSYAGGVFNDWYDTGEKLSESSTEFIGRVTGLPLLSADEASLIHLGLGVRHTNAKAGIRYRGPPEVNFARDFVDTGTAFDTGLFPADSAITYDFELSARRGPVWLASEFLATNVSAPDLGNPTFFGYHVTASWIATGEMRGYNKRSGIFNHVLPAKPVTEGGWGAWEFAVRFSSLDLTDGAIEGGEMQILSLGANWWLAQAASVGINFRNINLDRFGIEGNAKGITARFMVMLR